MTGEIWGDLDVFGLMADSMHARQRLCSLFFPCRIKLHANERIHLDALLINFYSAEVQIAFRTSLAYNAYFSMCFPMRLLKLTGVLMCGFSTPTHFSCSCSCLF